jgi:alpha-galactosidase
MTPDVASILMNKEVIAIDQDALGRQGDRLGAEGPLETWWKPLKGDRKGEWKAAIAIFNFGDTAGVSGVPLGLDRDGTMIARDVWSGKDLGKIDSNWRTTIPRHGVVLLVVR